MISPTIYDLPSNIPIVAGAFMAGGGAQDGGLTVGGAMVKSPLAGGRAVYRATIGNISTKGRASDSWFMSMAVRGAVFCVPIYRSRQLVSAAALGYPSTLDGHGLPWSNGQPFDTDENGAFDPGAVALNSYSAGGVSLTLDLTAYDEPLGIGHVIGHKNRAYLVEDIRYELSGNATLTVTPPLRKAVSEGDWITFRPKMYATVDDAGPLQGQFRYRKWSSIGEIVFNEAFVA